MTPRPVALLTATTAAAAIAVAVTGAPAAALSVRTDCGRAVQVSGTTHTLLRTHDGHVLAAGANGSGQLGVGSTATYVDFSPVVGLDSVVHAESAAGTSFAIRSDGSVWAWGSNAHGKIGDGGPATVRSSPVPVPALTGARIVTGSDISSYAVMPDGTLLSWGKNNSGALGDGTTTDRVLPQPVPGLTGVVDIAAQFRRAWVLRSDGTVWGWGFNLDGGLGDGTTTTRLSAVAIPGLSNMVQISRHGSLGVRADGTVWRWGETGTSQVPAVTDAVAVSGSVFGYYVLRADGTLLAAGYNEWGAVGDGTTEYRLTPVPVADLGVVTSFAASDGGAVAVDAGGDVWAWGANHNRGLGVGPRTALLRPRQTVCPERAPQSVTAIAPAAGAEFASDQRLRGFRASAQDIDGDRYQAEFEVRDASGAVVVTRRSRLVPSGAEVDVDLDVRLPAGTYTWTVTAIDEWGYPSAEVSPPRAFQVRLASSECAGGATLHDGPLGPAYVKVVARSVSPTATWLCVRVDGPAGPAGGRFTVDADRLANLPTYDSAGAFCRTGGANRLPPEAGEQGLYLDDERLYVCADTRRVGIPTGPATFVLDTA